MRLPWPFGRRTTPAAPSTDSSGDAAGRSDAPATAATGLAPSVPSRAWASLPPIQRAIADPPLVAPAAPFLAEVPGHRPLPPIVQPLGHEASPTAPPGIVVAHPRPVPSLTSHAPLPTRPVQRRAAVPATDEWSSSLTVADDPGASGPAPAATAAAAIPDPEPVRTLGVVTPSATTTPPVRPLTRTAPTLTPLAATDQRAATPAAVQRSASAPAPSTAATPAPGAGVRRTGLGEPLGSEPPRRGALELPVNPAAAPDGSRASAPRLDLATGPSRRPGLGAPLPARPESAVAQRTPSPGGPALAHASAGAPPTEGPPMTGGPAASSHAAAVTPSAAPAGRALPVLPVARRRSEAPATTADHEHAHHDTAPGIGAGPSVTASSGATPAAGQGATTVTGAAPLVARSATATPPTGRSTGTPGIPATSSAPEIRPIVGARPLRPMVAQRAAAEPVAGAAPAPSASPVPVVARHAADEELPVTVSRLAEVAAPAERPVPLTPLAPIAAPAAAPATNPAFPAFAPSPSAAFPGLTPVPLTEPGAPGITAQRAPAPGLPGVPVLPGVPGASPFAPGPAAAGALPQRPSATGIPAGSPPVQRAGSPLPLARPAASAPVPAAESPSAAGPAGAPAVQRATVTGAGGVPVATVTATPVVQRVEGTAPEPAPDTGGHSDTELDELARALFGRIRTHLRAEVIHEREARGLGFDAF